MFEAYFKFLTLALIFFVSPRGSFKIQHNIKDSSWLTTLVYFGAFKNYLLFPIASIGSTFQLGRFRRNQAKDAAIWRPSTMQHCRPDKEGLYTKTTSLYARMINNFNFSVKLLTHSITLKLIFEFSLVSVRLVSTLRNYCINIMPSIGSPPRGVRQPKKLPCLDFCEIKRGTGSSGTAVAVFVEWLPCLPKIYCGGPVNRIFKGIKKPIQLLISR